MVDITAQKRVLLEKEKIKKRRMRNLLLVASIFCLVAGLSSWTISLTGLVVANASFSLSNYAGSILLVLAIVGLYKYVSLMDKYVQVSA